MGCIESKESAPAGDSRNAAAANTAADTGDYYARHPGLRSSRAGSVDLESSSAFRVRAPDPSDLETLHVKSVDLNIGSNASKHHTDQFDNPNLIVRRGQVFEITVELDREYHKGHDDLRLSFKFESSKRSKPRPIELMLSEKDDPKDWGAMVMDKNGNSIRLKVNTPPTCNVGIWSLNVDVVKEIEGVETHFREKPSTFYVLFNPWCEADSVYLKDENLLKEYVLNDNGRLYVGSSSRFSPRPWVFGQFDGNVLDCAIYLLDRSGLRDWQRGNPVPVSREISAQVNSSDDGGVLAGNWSGDYRGGTSPTKWTGSAAILEQYFSTRSPVKYGQCWVFSAVTTTVCRAIGIPARSVTNFASAHDTDKSMTIDNVYNSEGDKISRDSIWNFHVWNEAWFARPDLGNIGYGGWQAFDATPQERSDGYYCTGPVPVVALKNGDTMAPYDGPFVFAEVNGHVLRWEKLDNGTRIHLSTDSESVGQKISTKAANKDEREDLTHAYKFPEGSDEGKAAMKRALANTSNADVAAVFDIDKPKEVKMKLVSKDDTFYGDNIDVNVVFTNDSDSQRTVHGMVKVSSVFYTGVHHKDLKTFSFKDKVIPAGKELEVPFTVTVGEYLSKFIDYCNYTVTGLAIVDETEQHVGTEKAARLRKPHLAYTVPSSGAVGEPLEVKVSFRNPLPVRLTNCVLTVEGVGLQKNKDYPQPDVREGDQFEGDFKITPSRRGEREIVCTLNSKELLDVNGSHRITIK